MSAEKLALIHARASHSPWSQASFEQQLELTGTLLAQRSHAFALGRAVLDEAELLQIATDPDYQRQGYARAVLAEFESLAAHCGCARCFLEVAQSNRSAIALYENAGWAQIGSRKDYYRLANGAREDARLMAKTL